jgi:GT2 family glycosyltransferase
MTVSRARPLAVLPNNDTVPQPGWLDALLDTFGSVPDAGLVGSQLLYRWPPAGVGRVIFADGSGWSYGRFEAADIRALPACATSTTARARR